MPPVRAQAAGNAISPTTPVRPAFESLLPQDSRLFQGNRNTGTMRYHSHRIVGSRACRGHRYAIGVAAGPANYLANAFHLLPHRAVAVDSVGIELDSHRIRVKVIEINLSLKHVLIPIGLDLHFTEAQRGPLVLQGLMPIDQLPAYRALVGTTLTEGCRTREVMLFSVFAHRADRRKARRKRAMLSRIRATQAVGMPCSSRL